MCAVSIRPLVIISKSTYEMPTFIHLLRRQLLAYGITLPAAFQGAPRSQPSEIMLSEWVSESPTATCASCRRVCVMVCRSVCQKEADDRGATRVLPFFVQQWTKPDLVFFLPFVIIYFSLLFVLSLVLPFPFPFYFCFVQYSCSFSIAVLYLYLYLFRPFFFFLLNSSCRSYPLCASHSFLIPS